LLQSSDGNSAFLLFLVLALINIQLITKLRLRATGKLEWSVVHGLNVPFEICVVYGRLYKEIYQA